MKGTPPGSTAAAGGEAGRDETEDVGEGRGGGGGGEEFDGGETRAGRPSRRKSS